VAVRQLPHGADLPLPAYATAMSAGMDLLAAVPETVLVGPGSRCLIPSGIAIALPEGHEAQVRPRSGLAARHGITVLNTPGTIDADYRGEIIVILMNLGDTPFPVERGMRIAQLVVAPVDHVRWTETAELSASERSDGGLGSTGTTVLNTNPERK
jgi:dUTP pyrophosphatase